MVQAPRKSIFRGENVKCWLNRALEIEVRKYKKNAFCHLHILAQLVICVRPKYHGALNSTPTIPTHHRAYTFGVLDKQRLEVIWCRTHLAPIDEEMKGQMSGGSVVRGKKT